MASIKIRTNKDGINCYHVRIRNGRQRQLSKTFHSEEEVKINIPLMEYALSTNTKYIPQYTSTKDKMRGCAIYKRDNRKSKWEVRIRLKGHKPLTKLYTTFEEAEAMLPILKKSVLLDINEDNYITYSKLKEIELKTVLSREESQWCKLIEVVGNRGKILSSVSDYINKDSKIKIKCNCGYPWQPSYHHIVTSKSWCPECQKGKTEKKIRLLFTTFFKSDFKNCWPLWTKTENQNHPNILEIERLFLKIPNKGGSNVLELDGFNEKLKIAFEYQGYQHYELSHYQKKHINQLKKYSIINRNDLIKKRQCEKLGIALYEIPQIEQKYHNNIYRFIDKVSIILEKQGLKMTFTAEQIRDMEKKF